MGFLCPSNEALIRNGVERFGDQLDSLPKEHLVRAMVRGLTETSRFDSNLKCHASQFLAGWLCRANVFSHSDNFTLVREMTSKNPDNKYGLRFTIS